MAALPALLTLALRRLSEPLAGIDDATFLVEREVVRNELRERGELRLPGAISAMLATMLLEPGHPYARPVIGTHESLSATTLADAEAFAREHYRPDNVTMVLAGDLRPGDVEALFAAHGLRVRLDESTRPPSRGQRVSPERKDPASPTWSVTEVDAPYEIEEPEVWVAWATPGLLHGHSTIEMELLARALSSAAERVREAPRGDVRSGSVSAFGGVEGGVFAVQLSLRRGADPQRSAHQFISEVFKLWTRDPFEVGKSELRRAAFRTATITTHARAADGLLDSALVTAIFTHYSGDAQAALRAFDDTSRITTAEISRIIERYLPRERARILVVRPKKERDARPAGLTGVGVVEDDTTSATSSLAPSIDALLSEPVRPVRRFTLDNGLRVITDPGRPGHGVELTIGLLTNAGAEPKPGVAILAGKSVRTRDRRAGSADDYGATTTWSRTPDFIELHAWFPAGNFENGLAILRQSVEVEVRPRWENRRKDDVTDLVKKRERPEAIADRARLRAVFGVDGYGRTAGPNDLAQIEAEDLRAYIDRVHRPENAVLVVAGVPDSPELEGQVRRWFDDWKRGADVPVPAPKAELPPAPDRVRWLFTAHPGQSQVAIGIDCAQEEVPASREAVSMVFANLVREELAQSIRRELGAAYAVSGGVSRFRSGVGAFGLRTSVDDARLAEVLALLARKLDGWRTSGADPRRVEAARWAVARGRSARGLTNERIVDDHLSREILGDPPDADLRFAAELRAVSKPAVDAELGACLRRMVVSLEGPEDVVRAALPSNVELEVVAEAE